MEDNNKRKSICFDQIEKRMQELDATNTESNSSTPPAMDLLHRPIILQPQIKEEPKDKDTGNSALQACVDAQPVNACNNNVVSETPTLLSGKGSILYTSAETQHTLPLVPIKTERVENIDETSLEPPTKDTNRNDNEQQITNPTAVEPITRIKSEPVDTPFVTEVNSLQIVPTTVAAIENTNDKNAQEVQAEINMDSTAPNSPNVAPDTDETLPDSFFDDLIKDADNITAAALKSNAANVTSQQHTQEIINVKNLPVDTTVPVLTTAGLESSTAPNNTTQEIDYTQVFLNVKTEPVDATTITEATPSAPIPENFFDDLLVDHVAEHIDGVVNHDLEIKYSERLKELQTLEALEQSTQKVHKKHKKKKKKSHKRTHSEVNEEEESISGNHKRRKHASRSHSKSPIDLEEQDEHNASPTIPQSTRIRIKSEFSSNRNSPIEIFNLDSEKPETSASAARRMLRVKSEFSAYQPIENSLDVCLNVTEKELFQRRGNINRNGLIVDMTAPLGFKHIKMESDVDNSIAEKFLSPKDKMENAKHRAIAAIDELNKSNKKSKDHSFIFTNTVRKLPHSSSYIRQQIYDYRSPLHNVKNVLYKFNSHANQFNLHEWGIEEMSRKTRDVAKCLGFDIHALDLKWKTIKLPPKIQKIKNEYMEQTEKNLMQAQTSFLATVSTQTDKVIVLDATGKHQRDIAVQAMSKSNNIGTQTTVTSTIGSNNYEDLPLMRQISTFNENQLMALNDFADLICEPTLAADANAMDLYRLRQRMLDIYKCAQLPSELRQNIQQPSQQIIQDPRQERMYSPSQPPPPSFQPQFAQRPTHPIINQIMRDPRQERMLTMQECRPPSWPTAHPVVRSHYQRPLEYLQQQPPLPLHHQRLPTPAAIAHKMPTNAPRPVDPRQMTATKYYGRGGMRH